MPYAKKILAALNKVLSKKFGLGELVVLGIIVVSTISYALAWQAPGSNPPSGNTDAPLNVGATAQYKSGGLLLNTGGAGNGLIVQNGNVGIGTTKPSFRLSLEGTSVGAGMYINNTTAANRNATVYVNDNGYFSIRTNGDNDRLNIDMNGNVGIGTTKPMAKLEVVGNMSISGGNLAIWIGEARVTLQPANLGEDSYGSWAFIVEETLDTVTDSCDGNNYGEYSCSTSDRKSCVDRYSNPVFGTAYYRDITCKISLQFSE